MTQTRMTPPSLPPFKGHHLQLELVDPGSVRLIRAYEHPMGDWHPAPVEFRRNHVDPPPGYGDAFAMLCTASNIQAAATEVRAMWWDPRLGRSFWCPKAAAAHRVARFELESPGLFIPIDGPNRMVFGLQGRYDPSYETSRWVALALFRRYGHLAHGLSYESFHRFQPGRVYAIWHSRKEGLLLRSKDGHPAVIDDPEWRAFLGAHPEVERQPGARGEGWVEALDGVSI